MFMIKSNRYSAMTDLDNASMAVALRYKLPIFRATDIRILIYETLSVHLVNISRYSTAGAAHFGGIAFGDDSKLNLLSTYDDYCIEETREDFLIRLYKTRKCVAGLQCVAEQVGATKFGHSATWYNIRQRAAKMVQYTI